MPSPSVFDPVDSPDQEPIPGICAYVSKSGKTTCDKAVVPDEDYCVLHGASMARSAEVVQRRLLSLQEKSLSVLEDLLISAFDDRVRSSVAFGILDRTGHGPKSTVAIEKSENLSHLSTEEIATELEQLAVTARTLKTTNPPTKPSARTSNSKPN